MGNILSPLNHLYNLLFGVIIHRNRVCSTASISNYYKDSIFGSYFLIASPIPILEELSIEELCFIHDMKEEEIEYELEFGSISIH